MLALVCAYAMMQPSQSELFAQYGRETLEAIRRDYYDSKSGLYRDAFSTKEKKSQVAFNWGVGVLIPALNAAVEVDAKFKPVLKEYLSKIPVYWNTLPPVAGFDVLPTPKPVDRYYDDNEWMVMALADSYAITKDIKQLKLSEDTLKFALSGEDDVLGGGIYWKEEEKTSKNTCSNGPGAAACLAVYEHTKNKDYLLKAEQLYLWTKKTLQDPTDHLFWDNINLKGKIEKTKWSYNTALMIRSGAYLYEITKKSRYADDVRLMVKASLNRWLKENPDHFDDGGRFAHLLLENLFTAKDKVPGIDLPLDRIANALVFLHDKVRESENRYPGDWNKPRTEHVKYEMIDQAAVARAYFTASKVFSRVESPR